MAVRQRIGVASRVLAGTVGSYGVASVAAAAFARILPGPRIEAVIAATLIGLAAVPAATIWAFAAATPVRAWGGLGVAAGVLTLVAWVAGLRA